MKRIIYAVIVLSLTAVAVIAQNYTFSTTTFTGPVTNSTAGALSQASMTYSGAPVTGGSGTTTFPLIYANSGTAPTTWSTSGTVSGINAPSGFSGNFIDYHLNGGTSVFRVASSGTMTTAGNVTAFNYNATSGHILLSSTAPTVLAAGCGGSGASITTNNGTGAFKVNVGTSNTGTCTITMPTATTDWICSATDITRTTTTVSQTKSIPGGTPATQITLQNYTDISGTGAWTDSDVIAVSCVAE